MACWFCFVSSLALFFSLSPTFSAALATDLC